MADAAQPNVEKTSEQMRILFDGHIFNEQRVGGVSRYFARLVQHLNNEPDCRARLLVPFSQNEHLGEVPAGDLYGLCLPRWLASGQVVKWTSDAIASAVAPWLGADIVHETYYQIQPRITVPARRVTTVYDMIHEELGIADEVAAAKAAAVARCDHVICISENTRNELVARCDIPVAKTTVVHLASDDFGAMKAASGTVNGGRPFLLHVGRRGGYKNFSVIVRALAGVGGTVGQLDLVSFSKSRFRQRELYDAQACGLDPARLVHASGSDTDLAQYYRAAVAMVFPSLHEGFGLPLIEAMSAGCPVLCSRRSCLTEIAADAALYFDPEEIASVRQAIAIIVESETVRNGFVARGNVRWREFSWEKCAKETASVYRRVLQIS